MTVPFLVGSDQGDPDRGEVAARRTTVTLARSAVTQAYSRFAVLPILLGVLILAQIEDGSFLTWSSIQLTLQQNAPLGIIAVGLTFVLIGGGIDISVGALYAAGASVYAKIALHHSLILAFAAAVAAGIVAGTVNGLLVTRLKFNPFVATLGTASLFGGLVVVYAGNQALVPHNPAFGDLGNNSLGGVAYVVIIIFATYLACLAPHVIREVALRDRRKLRRQSSGRPARRPLSAFHLRDQRYLRSRRGSDLCLADRTQRERPGRRESRRADRHRHCRPGRHFSLRR
jgi:ABC-type xylose transport system permease subunit